MSLVSKMRSYDQSSYEPVSAGLHPAVCFAVIDLGEQFSERYGNYSPQLMILFEVTDETITVNGEEQPKTASFKVFNSNLNSRKGKTTFCKTLESWRGRPLSEDFNNGKLIGAPCYLTFTEYEKNDGSINTKITGINPLPKGFAKPELSGHNKKLFFDVDESPLSDLNSLPKWIADIVMKSKNYVDRTSATLEPPEMTELPEDESEELPF